MNNNQSLYAVMGNPVAHSKSPLIHKAFAKQIGIAIEYQAIMVDTQAGAFHQALDNFKAAGGKGINVTVPFKQVAWALTQYYNSDSAKQAQAVNTLWFDEYGLVIGDNTDGVGLIRDITQNHKKEIVGRSVLILGAGGAVRGILQPLLKQIPSQCIIVNRTATKAKILAESFSKYGYVETHHYHELAGQTFDIIINGTSASLQGTIPPLPASIIKDALCYDMAYSITGEDTIFMQWAKEQGASCVLDGLGMLVEQAAESFLLWHGILPDTQAVINQLRS